MINNTYKIYLLTFEDGYVYVGKTKRTLSTRFSGHKHSIHKKYKLYTHWSKLNSEPTIECLESNLSKEQALMLEHDYILAYMYMTDKVLNENIGSNLSDKVKEKIGITRKGKYCGENSSFYGRKHSEETKLKISKANKGKLIGENNPMYGKTHSDEVKNRLSKIAKINSFGENNPMYGKHHSCETKNKIRLALGKPKDYYAVNPTIRSSFKRSCSRYNWNFSNFEEIFHSYKVRNNKKISTYLYIFRGLDYINIPNQETVGKKDLKYWETHSTPRYHFKRVCNSRGLEFEDFNEVLDNIHSQPNRKKYFYFKKSY